MMKRTKYSKFRKLSAAASLLVSITLLVACGRRSHSTHYLGPQDFHPSMHDQSPYESLFPTLPHDLARALPPEERKVGKGKNEALLGELTVEEPQLSFSEKANTISFKGRALARGRSFDFELFGGVDPQSGTAILLPSPSKPDDGNIRVRGRATCLAVVNGLYSCSSMFLDLYVMVDGVKLTEQFELQKDMLEKTSQTEPDEGSQGKTDESLDPVGPADMTEPMESVPTTVPVEGNETEGSDRGSDRRSDQETDQETDQKQEKSVEARPVDDREESLQAEQDAQENEDQDFVEDEGHSEPYIPMGRFQGYQDEVEELFETDTPASWYKDEPGSDWSDPEAGLNALDDESTAKQEPITKDSVEKKDPVDKKTNQGFGASSTPAKTQAPLPAARIKPPSTGAGAGQTREAEPQKTIPVDAGKASQAEARKTIPAAKSIGPARPSGDATPKSQVPEANAPATKNFKANDLKSEDSKARVLKSEDSMARTSERQQVSKKDKDKDKDKDKEKEKEKEKDEKKDKAKSKTINKIKSDKKSDNADKNATSDKAVRNGDGRQGEPSSLKDASKPSQDRTVQPLDGRSNDFGTHFHAMGSPIQEPKKKLKCWPSGRPPVSSLGSSSGNQDQALGCYMDGLLNNPSALDLNGTHYWIKAPKRKTHYGTHLLVAFVDRLAKVVSAILPDYRLVVGDLSKKSGGPLGTLHSSHRNGLDADIGYLTQTQQRQFVSIVSKGGGLVSQFRKAEQWKVFKKVVNTGYVSYIFVGRSIKRGMCEYAKEIGEYQQQKETLRRLYPWSAHDNHWHLRLRCPRGNPRCRGQVPPPNRQGC